MTDTFIIPDNKTKQEEYYSPSKKYKLIVSTYKTKQGCWEYTCGEVFRVADDKLICSIPRNYCSFMHSFLVKNNQEWLQTGKTYMSQTFVNLDTGEMFDDMNKEMETKRYKKGWSFCWSSSSISPDGNTLVVCGCYWGASSEIKFYDFTDPSKGWPELKCDAHCDGVDLNNDEECGQDENDPDFINLKPHWNPDGTFTMYEASEYLQYEGKNYGFQDDEYHDLEEKLIPEKNKMFENGKMNQDVFNVYYDKYQQYTKHIVDYKITVRREDDKMVIVDEWKSDDRIRWEKAMNDRNKKHNEKMEKLKSENIVYQKMAERLKQSNHKEKRTTSGNYSCFVLSASNHSYSDDDENINVIKKSVSIQIPSEGNNDINVKLWYYGKGDWKTLTYENNVKFVDVIFDEVDKYLNEFVFEEKKSD